MVLKYNYRDENGQKVSKTSSYYPYDKSFYIINLEGKTHFFADKRNIDNIAKAIMEFKGKED